MAGRTVAAHLEDRQPLLGVAFGENAVIGAGFGLTLTRGAECITVMSA